MSLRDRLPDPGAVLFAKVVRTIELAGKVLDEIIDCEHGPYAECRCGNPEAYTAAELCALDLIYRCGDMFADSATAVTGIDGLVLPPRRPARVVALAWLLPAMGAASVGDEL